MSYAKNLTSFYNGGHSPNIIGRDNEIEKIFLTLMRFEKPNCLIKAEPGIGKTALVHQVAYLIANQLCPKDLFGFQVIEINTNALLAGPGYRGVTEEKFQNLIDRSIDNGKIVLFFDEFHTVESLGKMSNGQTPGLGNTLKPYLTRPDFRVIGATTNSEFKTIQDSALLRRFSILQLEEPSKEALLIIAESCFKKYGSGIRVNKECLELSYKLSLSRDGYNPDKIKDIIDLVIAHAKLKQIDEITPSFLTESFNTLFNVRKTKVKEEVIFT